MFFHMVYKSEQIFLPFCHIPRVWRTDRRTDGQTDRILIARPRLHFMQRGKNDAYVFSERSRSLYVIARPSLSSVVCTVRAPYSGRRLKFSVMFLRHLIPWPSVTFR